MGRKTIEVQKLKDYANEQLARTDEFADTKFKAGICVMIEHFLIHTGNYHGYNDQYWLKQGYKEWEEAGKPETWPEKDKYIYGPSGCKYSRIYY